jgi:O-antigen ligase
LPRLRFTFYAAAFLLLVTGIALTAMRTALVAFACGACVVAWRATSRGRARIVVSAVVACALALGAFAVWRTRAEGALRLQDESSRLRLAVARVALARTPSHPIFGHGMDAVKRHWTEWGFPGHIQIHTHSTPLQLAFERGLPALLLWLWLLAAFWLTLTRGERAHRAADDAGAHGLLLGATGAFAGFCASSLVNYNFGDAEVALVLWWLMGTAVKLSALSRQQSAQD